jgi:hypothetical protein
VVLVLVAAGAAATLTVDALMVASALLAAAAILRPMVRRLADRRDDDGISSLVPAGLVAIALALDAFRADARPEWAVTLLGGVVIATIAAEAISTMASVRTVPT